jgi:hypothetical protein
MTLLPNFGRSTSTSHTWPCVYDLICRVWSEIPPELQADYQNTDRRSRAQKWHAAVAELIALQDDYRTWLNALPQNLEANATAEALRAICDLDLSDLESVEPPRGFGRD